MNNDELDEHPKAHPLSRKEVGSEPPPANRGANSPARIRDAAAELFAVRGYHATTMRQLGAALGITAPSLYNHYSDKHQILLDITRDAMLELLAGGEKAVESSSSPPEQLRAFIRAHIRFHIYNQMEAYVADSELHSLQQDARAEVIELRDRYEKVLFDILIRGQEESDWHIPDIQIVGFAIFGMATGVVMWLQPDGRLTGDEVAEIYSDLIILGLTGNGA